jgi:dihydropyrimidinase
MTAVVITGAKLVDGNGVREGTLRVEGERIAEVLSAGIDAAAVAARHGADLIDGRGRWLIPGGIDPHVHFALPVAGTITCDDFASGTRAALAGGTTTIMDFVTPVRGESLRAAVEARLREASSAVCDYSLHLSVTEWRAGMVAELRDVSREYGLRSVKLYMAYLETIGLADDALASAMKACADLDITVLLHAEDGAEIAWRQRALLAAGEISPAAHARSRPPAVEEVAVRRALGIVRRTGCRLYVVHVSTAGAIAAITAARAAGQNVFAETCPQYLCLDERAYDGSFDRSANYVMSPPLRARAHCDALRTAVARGEFDVFATDHCAFTEAQKVSVRGDFTRIPGGVAGVEQRLAVTYKICVVEEGMPPSQWVRLITCRAAEIFGLNSRKGSLAVGADADLVLWDPDHEWTITAAAAHSHSGHSIFEGVTVRGQVDRVWSRGALTVADDRVIPAEGRGCHLRY